MNEIKIENEMVAMNKVSEYLNRLAKKFGQGIAWYDNCGTTRFVSYKLCHKFDAKKSIEFGTTVSTVTLTLGISTMGDLPIEDMSEAADEIKAAVKIAETFNDRMNCVYVIWKYED